MHSRNLTEASPPGGNRILAVERTGAGRRAAHPRAGLGADTDAMLAGADPGKDKTASLRVRGNTGGGA